MSELLKNNPDKIMVIKTYNSMNQEMVGKIFYGDVTEANKILIPLRKILFDGESTEEQYAISSFFYTQVWIRKHGGTSPEYSSTPYIKEAMQQRFSGFQPDRVIHAVDRCLEYIYAHEPALSSNGTENNTSPVSLSNVPYRYVISYKQGVKLFDQGDYKAAIDSYKKCLEYKSDDTIARFEIAEAYIHLGNLDKAKETLLEAVPFIIEVSEKARLYRRLGFIDIEQTHFKEAAALLQYSWLIEKNPRTMQELQYIKSIAGREADFSDSEAVNLLKENDLLFWETFDNINSTSDDYNRTIGENKTSHNQRDISKKEMWYKKFIEVQAQRSPSDLFASGSVFDISRRFRDEFEKVVQSADALELKVLFAKAYYLFLEHPDVVGFTPNMINKDNDDTQVLTWNADIINLAHGDYAALLYMPIDNDTIAARIVGIIFSNRGDGYYYCMLNKDRKNPSVVKRNKAMNGIEDIGEVKGVGFSLMKSFLNCIKTNYYR